MLLGQLRRQPFDETNHLAPSESCNPRKQPIRTIRKSPKIKHFSIQKHDKFPCIFKLIEMEPILTPQMKRFVLFPIQYDQV
jgi:hypothetical protein